ncbi:class III aminotransferase [Neohortaea acidophila]|uniref:Class III aminotransferase n=1 Tax=Neohortaea acidophila TaxID=245834 RepID=A0A6A6Q7M4_9PEZI|nr:class III aminotransferase [Neohortaea acidophila]KAF2488071.1 class III aminotransferase [Neohortaea acidophila]
MTPDTAKAACERAEQDFIARNPKSRAIYQQATESLPGGNTRTAVFYPPFPVSIARAEGARLYDADGHEFVDLLGEFTAGLYGHSPQPIIDTIHKTLQRGISYGSQHEDEGKLAALVKLRFPSMDLLRFTNSGTEANLMALAAATVHTGKKKVLVFDGAYHGGAFTFKNGQSSPINAPYPYLIAKYNDEASVSRLLSAPENAGNVAAILVEPMIGSGGAIPAHRTFLHFLRKAATDAGALLIFDEVMTSRMHSGGGIQSQLPPELRPDLTALGKYLGGGMSFGAFGGKRAIMEMFDPRKPTALAHAGTFNNNVLTMAAGRCGLEQIFTPERAQELQATGERLLASLREASGNTLMKITGYGSILCFHFTRTAYEDIREPGDVYDHDKDLGALFHLWLLERGFYIARRGFFALSLVLTQEDLEAFVQAVREFVRIHAAHLGLERTNGVTNGH